MEDIPVHELEKLVFINSEGLKELSLTGKQLSRVPDAVTKMTNVEVLNLSNNNLTGLPHDIYQLTKLSELDLSHNSLRVQPEVICQLRNLKKLNMSWNQLTMTSVNLAKLEHLQELDLSHNSLRVQPEVTCKLKNLKTLNMSQNQLTSISDNITNLKHLQDLNLSHNSLEVLLGVICHLKYLKYLSLEGNPLKEPSAVICKQGLPAIRTYFLDVGSSGARKTSLAETLMSNQPSSGQKEDTTIVVDRRVWKTEADGRTDNEQTPACLVHPVGDGSEQMTSFKTDSPSQEVLSLLAEEVCFSWKALGKQLCIADADLNQIEADNQELYEQCYSMLKRWTQVQASPPTYEDLARALQSKPVDRGDLAAKYCSVGVAHKSREVYSPIMDWSFKDGKPTEEEILSLAKEVQEGNWKQLGRALKLKDSDLCEIDYDQRELFEKIHAMLSKWKKVRGKLATYRDLAEGLERVGRRDLIREFCCVPK